MVGGMRIVFGWGEKGSQHVSILEPIKRIHKTLRVEFQECRQEASDLIGKLHDNVSVGVIGYLQDFSMISYLGCLQTYRVEVHAEHERESPA